MTDYEEIKATLESKGAKIILHELRNVHKATYRRYRECSPDELIHLQQLQKLIDTTLPGILERLMNKHLDKTKKSPEWWHFAEWFRSKLR